MFFYNELKVLNCVDLDLLIINAWRVKKIIKYYTITKKKVDYT